MWKISVPEYYAIVRGLNLAGKRQEKALKRSSKAIDDDEADYLKNMLAEARKKEEDANIH